MMNLCSEDRKCAYLDTADLHVLSCLSSRELMSSPF